MNQSRTLRRTAPIAAILGAAAILALAGCGKNDSAPAPIAAETPAAAAPADNMPTGTGAHGDPGAPKSTPNGTGGTTEATGDNISTGSAGGVPNAGAANADGADRSAKPASAASSPK
jgi:hypothetical protein